jgi:hypothetical protein
MNGDLPVTNAPHRQSTDMHGAGEQEAVCEARERTLAIVGLVASFLLALSVVLAAVFGPNIGGAGTGSGEGQDGDSLAMGHGSLDSADAGDGTGTEDAAGEQPVEGVGEVSPAAAAPHDDAPGDAAAETGSSKFVEVPRFSFKLPEAPTPAVPSAPTFPLAPKATPSSRGSDFMGVKSKGLKIVYVIDRTLSMKVLDDSGSQRFAQASLELQRSIKALPPEASFSVIFFAANSVREPDAQQVMPPGRMTVATASNKAAAIRWISKQKPSDEIALGYPSRALRTALLMHPDTIYFMTDGAPGVAVDKAGIEILDKQGQPVLEWSWITDAVKAVHEMNAGGAVQVNTITFHEQASEAYLKQMAMDGAGTYRYVPPSRGTRPR